MTAYIGHLSTTAGDGPEVVIKFEGTTVCVLTPDGRRHVWPAPLVKITGVSSPRFWMTFDGELAVFTSHHPGRFLFEFVPMLQHAQSESPRSAPAPTETELVPVSEVSPPAEPVPPVEPAARAEMAETDMAETDMAETDMAETDLAGTDDLRPGPDLHAEHPSNPDSPPDQVLPLPVSAPESPSVPPLPTSPPRPHHAAEPAGDVLEPVAATSPTEEPTEATQPVAAPVTNDAEDLIDTIVVGAVAAHRALETDANGHGPEPAAAPYGGHWSNGGERKSSAILTALARSDTTPHLGVEPAAPIPELVEPVGRPARRRRWFRRHKACNHNWQRRRIGGHNASICTMCFEVTLDDLGEQSTDDGAPTTEVVLDLTDNAPSDETDISAEANDTRSLIQRLAGRADHSR